MKLNRSIFAIAALPFTFASTAQADPACLVGKWQAEEEVLNLQSAMPQLTGGDWSTGGSLTIEILPSSKARIVYDDYIVLRATERHGFQTLLEVRYSGDVEGDFALYSDMTVLTLSHFDDVSLFVRQRFGDRDWADGGSEDGAPPHEQGGYSFECSDDELVLSKSEDGPFGGDYRGRFVRVD